MSGNTQFAGKVIALTGAASGIGLATAHILASRGAQLSLADVQEEALQKAKADIEQRHPGAEVMTAAVDVRRHEQVDAWTAATVERFGRLDGAANLAGVIPPSIGLAPLARQDLAEWDFVMGVNSTGVMHCLRAQLAAMADGGSVVNASSIAGTTGRANNASYSASKHAVLGLTRAAAKEVGVRGIRVNAICPGTIETPMLKKSRDIAGGTVGDHPDMANVALKRIGRPGEVANLVVFLLSDESTYISGADISVDGGWRC
ncbi:3-oxoacyl-reductase [Pestalotiopsis sp. NC0098]|nr:3-oxoacyl-reductase [Pestalotiopsis sp. NC0098]